MVIDNTCAFVDTDFLLHVTETKICDADLLRFLESAFSSIPVSAIVHPLVYQHEVYPRSSTIQSIFSRGIISLPELGDIIGSSGERETYYCFLVNELYKSYFGVPLSFSNVLTEWKKKCSLGEIHSLAACLICGCCMFLSDDAGSKQLLNFIPTVCPSSIVVYNRAEFFSLETIKNAVPSHLCHVLKHKC